MNSLEKEFVNFFGECKQKGFTADEMRAICQPLLQQHKHANNKSNSCLMLSCVAILAALIGSYLLYSWCDEFNWFVSAIGRLLLLQLLPYWDWTSLYNKRCLIERSQGMDVSTATTVTTLGRYDTELGNCVLCETLERIATASNVTFSFLESTYLERGLPVIVTDSQQPRPLSTFIEQIFTSPLDFLQSEPCDISTNLMLKKLFNLELALQKIKNSIPSIANKWFLQFRVCTRRAVKASRHFIKRPYYYPLHLEPFYSSWVLMSQNYANAQLREIYLQGLIFVQQLNGYFDMRLQPKQPCAGRCPVVNIRLNAGECLVFSTDLWIFSYGTEMVESRSSASIATILEIDWQL